MESTVQARLSHAADQTIDVIERIGSPVCVGIDPVVERMPAPHAASDTSTEVAIRSIRAFTLDVLDAISRIVPIVKLQSACFERYRHEGVKLLAELIEAALQVEEFGRSGDVESARPFVKRIPGLVERLTKAISEYCAKHPQV